MLPADITDFTGRENETVLLPSCLRRRPEHAPSIVAVAGKPGVGKTALAVHAAHRLQDVFPGGQLFVDLHGLHQRPADPAEVLARFLRRLGVDSSAIPEGVEQRAEMYRDLLADRRVLVVLDNAAGQAQVSPLLPGSAACAVLVTGRARLTGLPGARLVELDVLDPGHAVELLARTAGRARVAAEPGAAMTLAGACGRLPLAVRIAGAKLAARPHYGIAELAARLADEHRVLDELAFDSLEVRGNLAVSYVGLDSKARRLFRRLGLLEAPDFAAWAGAALLDVPVSEGEEIVARLADAHLVEVVGRDPTGQMRYRLHDLVDLYARERALAEEDPRERTAALERALGSWLTLIEHAHIAMYGDSPPLTHSPQIRRWLDPASAEPAVSQPLAWYECERLGRPRLAEPYLRQALATARRTGPGGRAYVQALYRVGELDLAQQRLGAAARAFTEVLALNRRFGNLRGQAYALHGLAETRLRQQAHQQAADLLEQALVIAREFGERLLETRVLTSLGQLHHARRRLDRAAEALTQAADIAGGVPAPLLRANALGVLGQVRLEAGDAAAARNAWEQARDIFRDIGAALTEDLEWPVRKGGF